MRVDQFATLFQRQDTTIVSQGVDDDGRVLRASTISSR